jgi:GT2 family glycosyltransferase
MSVGVNLIVCNRTPAHWRATEVALASLRASDAGAARLIVVDNGSTSAPDWWARAGLDVIATGRNLGIAAGRNVGAKHLLQDPEIGWLVELHNDMVFPQVWLAPLLAALEADPRLGMACASLLTPKGLLGSPKVVIDYGLPTASIIQTVERAADAHRRPGLIKPGLQHPVVKRVAMLREIGLYDEQFAGMNFEDTDEVYRAAKAGWRYVVVGDTVVWHSYLFSRLQMDIDHATAYHTNQKRFLKKWPDAVAFLARYQQEIDTIYRPPIKGATRGHR